MKKAKNTKKNVTKIDKPIPEASAFKKAFDRSKKINNFATAFQFARDLGVELLKGTATLEHIETLKESITDIKDFIKILEEEIAKKVN